MDNQTQTSSTGPAIGIILIIAIIVIGGLYFWSQREKNNSVENGTQQDQTTQELQKQSSSDDVNSIEADLQATNLNNLGTEVDSAESATMQQ